MIQPAAVRLASFALAFALLLAAAPAGRAGEPHFPKGTRTFQAYGGYFVDLGQEDAEAGFLSAGVGYYFYDGVGLSLEATGYGVQQGGGGEDAWAGAFGIVLRHHLLERGDCSFFVDVAFAPFEATERVPPGGTHFNFVTQSGVGIAHRLRDDSRLLLGLRYSHLSNAQRKGDDRNPSLNGVSAYVGIMFSF